MAKELTPQELLANLIAMRDRQTAKHGEDSEEVSLVDEAITDTVENMEEK